MAKRKPGEQRVQLSFERPEDQKLYAFMEREAYRCRWDLKTFILASLTEAFSAKMEEYEVERMAAEAAQKVRERSTELPLRIEVANVPDSTPIEEAEKIAIKRTLSMDEAARMANEEIAKLDALAAKTMGKRLSARKGAGSPPPMPPMPPSTTPAKGKHP